MKPQLTFALSPESPFKLIVGIIEPYGKPRHGVTINGRFRRFDSLLFHHPTTDCRSTRTTKEEVSHVAHMTSLSHTKKEPCPLNHNMLVLQCWVVLVPRYTYLQTSWSAIFFIHHFQIHIKFGCDSRIDQILETFLDKSRKTRGDIQVTDGYSNLSVIEFLQEFRIEFAKNGGTIGHQESASTFGRTLEANKGGVGSCSFGGGFTMQSDVMPPQRWLIDLLIS